MEINNAPLWITKYFKYSESLGGLLITNHGFSNLDVSVYLFLFTKKLFDDHSSYNSYKISQELTKLSNENMLEEDRINYGSKNVSESLNKLNAKGFVDGNNSVDKKSRGRTPNIEYQATNIKQVREFTQKKLNEITKKQLNTLASLEDIEENVELSYEKEKKT